MNITIDGISFSLQEPHDFSWLGRFGTVFCVYDRQDSGNLLFGVERAGTKRFIKYAGARPIQYAGAPEEAVERLRAASRVYRDIRHPCLIGVQEFRKLPHGAAAVFEWFAGRGLHEHWTFDKTDKLHPDSPYFRYLHLPMEKRLRSVDEIFRFHIHVEKAGYVPVDFYDGSVMYDFDRDITRICDIDFYRKKPALNDVGADYFGSTRMKAPEEYVFGARIGSDTTVFTLGALLMHLFGRYTGEDIAAMARNSAFFPCRRDTWTLTPRKYEAALRAVERDRRLRHQTVAEFYRAWTQ